MKRESASDLDGGYHSQLKEVAPKNISFIVVTLDTSQLLSGWLKEVASLKIAVIFVTLDTFQLLSGWLKEVAP